MAKREPFPDAPWCTPGDAAQRAGLSPTHVIHLIKTGVLKAQRTVSGRYIISTADVEAFVKEHIAVDHLKGWKPG